MAQATRPSPVGQAVTPERIVVVVARSNPVETLKLVQLRRIFLRQVTRWPNGSAITVFERPASSRVRREFCRKIFGKEPAEFEQYWMNLQLTRGLRPPKVLRTPTLVKRYLARVKGGIAYLYESEVDDSVKVIRVEGLEPPDGRD